MKLTLIVLFIILCEYPIISEGKSNSSDYICSVSTSDGATSCDISKSDIMIPNIQESIAYDVVDRIDMETIGKGGISHNELVVALIHNISTYQEVLSTEFNRKPDDLISDEYGNQYVIFTGTDDVEISYQVILHSLNRAPRIIVTQGQDLLPLYEPYQGDHYFYAYEYTWTGDNWASLKVSQSWNIQEQTANTWYNKGASLAKQSKYSEAIEAFNKSIELNPVNATVWCNKGNVLSNLGKYNESVKAYETALKVDPQNIAAWNEKGHVLNTIGSYDEAVVAFSKVIKLNPKDADAWFNRGNTLSRLGRYDEAIKDYDEAIALKPKFVKAILNKSKALKHISIREN